MSDQDENTLSCWINTGKLASSPPKTWKICNRIIRHIKTDDCEAKLNYINLLFSINNNPEISSEDWLNCLGYYYLKAREQFGWEESEANVWLKCFDTSYLFWKDKKAKRAPDTELLCHYFQRFADMRLKNEDLVLIKNSWDFMYDPSIVVRYAICMSSIGMPVKTSFIEKCDRIEELHQSPLECDMEISDEYGRRNDYYTWSSSSEFLLTSHCHTTAVKVLLDDEQRIKSIDTKMYLSHSKDAATEEKYDYWKGNTHYCQEDSIFGFGFLQSETTVCCDPDELISSLKIVFSVEDLKFLSLHVHEMIDDY